MNPKIHLNRFLEQLPRAQLLLDRNCNVLFANSAFYSLLGLEPGSANGQPLASLTTDVSLLPLVVACHALNKGENHLTLDLQGESTTIHATGTRLTPESAGIAAMLWTLSLDPDSRQTNILKAELETSRALLHDVFRSIPDLLTVQDRNHNVIFSNSQGWLREGAEKLHLGNKCYKLYQMRDSPCENCQADEVFETGRPVVVEKGNPRDDSTWEIHAFPVKDDRGRVILVAAHAREITERKRAEDSLRHNEALYRSYIDHAPVGVFVVDANGRYCEVNAAACTMTGYTSEELLTMGVRDLATNTNPEDANLPTLKARGKLSGIIELRRKDGTTFQATLDAVALPDGRFMGFHRDITEQIRTEERLRESESSYRSLVETAPMPIVLHCDGECVYINPAAVAALGGQRAGQFLGKRVMDFIHKDCRQLVEERIKAIYSGKGPLEPMEQKYLRLDGEVIDVVTSASLATYRGRPASQVVFFDISAQKKAERERSRLLEQLRHTQKLESLGVLAGGIAHDFNNLLSGILGGAELALMELEDRHTVAHHLSHVRDTALQAADLCRQLLAYSGRGRFVVKPIDLSATVTGMRQMLEVSKGKRAKLKFALDRELPAVEADESQLRQVILNLVINAAEAIGDAPGLILVSTGLRYCDRDFLAQCWLDDDLPPGNYVFLEVNDTGCGIDKNTLPRVFDPFFTTKFTGRGLGLAATLGIIRGHRGAIKISSAPGVGSTFSAFFPSTDMDLPTPPPENPEPHARWKGSGTVQFIDDEPSVREVSKRMLEYLGVNVILSADGKEGVKVFRDHAAEIDLVFLDMTMPGMSGQEVFTEIRRIRPDARVVLISGYDEREATSHFANKDLFGFLQKPITLKGLLAVLKELPATSQEPSGKRLP